MTETHDQSSNEASAGTGEECTVIVLCPGGTGGENSNRPLLGMSVGERLLLYLAHAGCRRILFAGPGPRPSRGRADIEVIDQPAPDDLDAPAKVLVVPSDLVFDEKLLQQPDDIPGELPIRAVSREEARQVLGDPEGRLGAMPKGHARSAREFALRVEDEQDIRAAERALLQSLRKPIDGPVSRYLNRHISLFITSKLARLGVRPNHVTFFTMLVGLLAAGVVLQGEPWWVLVLAGVLFQAQSVLDGCDGELARLNHDSSLLGQWLDTISDQATDYLFCLGIALGQARVTGATWLYWAGGVVLALQIGCTILMYRRMIIVGTGSLLGVPDVLTKGDDRGLIGWALYWLKIIGKRNVYVMLVAVSTVLQVPLVGFWLMTFGSTVWFFSAIGNELKLNRMQREAD